MKSLEFETREGAAMILFRPEVPLAHHQTLMQLREREYASLSELSDVLYTATAGWGVNCQLVRAPQPIH